MRKEVRSKEKKWQKAEGKREERREDKLGGRRKG
jgi:hypothetical protein